jgi:hypothetical protein
LHERGIFDADGHVYEVAEEIFLHLEGPYAGKRTLLGFPLWPSLDGWQRGAIHAPLGIHKSFATSAETWLGFLDAAGIARTVLYPTHGLATGLIRDRDWAVALARAYNDWLAERYLRRSPRLLGVALLPLQDPEEAARELRRAVTELGMVGGVLPAVGLSRALGHPEFDPIYREAEALDRPLGVHGGPAQGLALDGLGYFAQVHTLSHPFSQMTQATSIVMSGVLDRFPRLRIAFLEAGVGWVPFLMDRMDRSWRARKLERFTGGARQEPSAYLRSGNLYFGVDASERHLRHCLEVVGAERVLFASDLPHEVNEDLCRREIEELSESLAFAPRSRELIFAENALRYYGLG